MRKLKVLCDNCGKEMQEVFDKDLTKITRGPGFTMVNGKQVNFMIHGQGNSSNVLDICPHCLEIYFAAVVDLLKNREGERTVATPSSSGSDVLWWKEVWRDENLTEAPPDILMASQILFDQLDDIEGNLRIIKSHHLAGPLPSSVTVAWMRIEKTLNGLLQQVGDHLKRGNKPKV